jgi:hypothetical protein
MTAWLIREATPTEAEMIADMANRAEKHMLDDGGPFFVLRIYLETGGIPARD